MNCGEFQNSLPEYVEGTLSSSGKAAAEEHLAHCGACREALEQEQRLGQFLSREFARNLASVKLGADARQRIARELSQETREPIRAPGRFFGGLRLAWPAATAVCVLVAAVLVGGSFFRPHKPKPVADQPQGGLRRSAAIQVSYVEPVYTFRQEGNLVVDSLTWTTNVVDQMLWVEN